MAKYEEKFIVINKKHFKNIPKFTNIMFVIKTNFMHKKLLTLFLKVKQKKR